MDKNYTQRKTYIATLDDLASKELLHLEMLRLYLPNSGKKNPIDMGAIAYSDRKFVIKMSSYENTDYLVVLESFLPARCTFLKRFIEYIITGGYRESSLHSLIAKVRKAFNIIDGYKETGAFLESFDDTSKVYQMITHDLRHKLNVGELTAYQAKLKQVSIAFLILIGHGRGTFDHIIKNTIQFSGKSKPTPPRELDEIRFGYETYKSLALGLTKSLVNNEHLPILLKMPDYETYLFPYANHRVTPFYSCPTDVYNDEEGRLVTIEEYCAKRPDKCKNELASNLRRTKTYLDEANTNMRAKCRRAFATTAMQAFQMLFMMLSGSYVSEMKKIEFDGAFEKAKSVTQKSYQVVKFRASGKIIQYELAHGAVELFKHYIRLREWVLDGKVFDELFFSLKVKSWEPCIVDPSSIRGFQRKKVIGVFMPASFEVLTSRQFRKTKSIFLHEQPEVSKETVAEVLGHSERTNEAHYLEVSPEVAKSEFSNFWESAHEAIQHISFNKDAHDGQHLSVAAGHCTDYQKPEPAIDAPPIKPDCVSQYGCLFCKHYVCHANDEDDVHKLFSLLYIVIGVMNASSEMAKSKELLLMLSSRVRQILLKIKSKSSLGAKNVKLYRERVFNYGELTPYWENRLQRYESMGMIFSEENIGESFEL